MQAPIKRRLSIKNTCPSQKYCFFAGSVSSMREDPFVYLHPVFQLIWCGSFLKSATRHPSGSRPVKEIINRIGFSLRPLVRLADPRKSSVPCHVQCVKITQIGLLVGQPRRTHDRGRSSKKAIRLDLSVRQCNDVPITKKGFLPAWSVDHRCNARLM